MLRKLAALACGAVVAALIAPALCAPAFAEETKASAATAETQTDVRITVRLGKLDQGKRTVMKSYDLVVVAGSSGSKLLSGSRVPIPTATHEPSDKGAGGDASTEFVYQNIGFSIEAKVWLVGDKKIKILGALEDSRLTDRIPGQPPVVETRQLSVNAVLADGTPMEVTRVEADGMPPGFVEIEARILK